MVDTYRLIGPENLSKELEKTRLGVGAVVFAVIDMDRWKSQPSLTENDLPGLFEHIEAAIQGVGGSQVEYLGRDEMAVIISYPDEDVDPAKLVELIDGMRRQVSEVASKELGTPVTFTAGLAFYPLHGDSDVELITAARSALEIGKRAGRDRTEISPGARKLMKSSYYDALQLARLRRLARRLRRTDAGLLREALERLLDWYDA